MKKYIIWASIVVFFFGLLGGIAVADEPAEPAVTKPAPEPAEEPTIILPIVPVLVEPEDEPVPEPPRPKPPGTVRVSELAADTWYVVESSIPLIFLHSPTGCVAVSHEEGPVKIRGKFADGTGGIETRTYKLPHVYSVNAIAAGKIELLIIPEGVKSEKDILRQQLTVMGQGPNPPPGPKPDPTPEPDPTPGPVTTFRVIFVKESGSTLSAQQSSVPAAAEIRNYLNRKTTSENGVTGWREYDPQQNVTNEQPNMKALWNAVKPNLQTFPCMVVEVNGRATIMPFPSGVADAMQTLKKAGGE